MRLISPTHQQFEGTAGAMQTPKTSIIVPCRNEKAHIEAVMASMLNQEGVVGGFEIVVADGRSDDGTRQLLDRLAAAESRLRVIDNPQQIVSPGLNLAIQAARGDVIVRMDTHTVYATDYVARCLEALAASGAQNVGGPALTQATGFMQKANALAYHSPFSVGGARFHDPAYEGWVDTVTYGCWHKDTLLRLGMFDEELVRNQDDELNLRLLRSGGRIWQTPAIRSWYAPRSSLAALFRQYVQYGYWKVRVIQKHRLPASVRHVVPGAFVASLLLLAPLAIVFAWAGAGLAALLGPYLLANLGASLVTCRRSEGRKYLLVMPLVFAAYHFGYGWGFLRGVIDFLVFRRSPRQAWRRLTR
jgi:glycosyltransferase involved in cell wall biosynthesis